MKRLTNVVLALLALVLGTSAAVGAAREAKTVVAGKVVLSPARPLCRTRQECTRPLIRFGLRFTRHGVVVARVATNTRGRYHVELAPGTYGVTPTTARRNGLSPRRIFVPARATATRNFTYDAGIR